MKGKEQKKNENNTMLYNNVECRNYMNMKPNK